YTEEEWRLLNNIYDDVFPTSQLEEDKSNESLANDSHYVILGSEEGTPMPSPVSGQDLTFGIPLSEDPVDAPNEERLLMQLLPSGPDLPIDTTPNVTDDPVNIPSLSSLMSISDSEFSNSPNPSSSRKRKPTFDKKRMTTENPSRRKFTTKYYLPLPTDDSTFETQQVCLKMFCGTLAITDQIIRTAHSKLDSCGITSSDNRGKHLNHPKKIDDEMIRSVCDHVKSFQPVESHYTRKNTSKLYLDNSLSFNKMFSMYKDWPELSKYNNTAETERQYRTIVNDHMNIAFFIPKKDLCDKCHAFSNEVSPTEEQPYNVIEVSQDMLYDLKELLQNRNFKKNTSNHDVKWNNIKEVCVKRSEPDIILYKYDLEGDYFRLNTLVQTRRNKKTVVDYCNDALKPLYSNTLPIPEAKYKDLIHLCEAGHIPRQYHAFFKNLKKVQSENVSGSDEDD
ncbi:hypothetical protein HW555_000508, partial [Spodoptera exigua]